MGRSNSKFATPTNPLQEMQLKAMRQRAKEKDKEKVNTKEKQLGKYQKERRKQRDKNAQKSDKNKANGIIGSAHNLAINGSAVHKDDFEKRIDAKLREQLTNQFCGFLLNQISMAVQFFGNYESERLLSKDYILQKENQFNQNLEEHSVIFPNALDKAVERRIRFKPKHGPDKHDISPLQSQTMYIVFENIDISKPNEANYDSITPICKVDMETDFSKAQRWKGHDSDAMKVIKFKGYVRLKLRLSEEENQIYGRQRMGVRNVVAKEATANDSEYDYAYITHLNTHHPLSELTMSTLRDKIAVQHKILPDSCISNFSKFLAERSLLEDADDDDDEEEESSDPEEDPYAHAEALEVCYLNSKSFLCYFADLLRGKLAPDLRLDESEFQGATYKGSSIHTKTYEIIPAIQVAHNAQIWPDCAFEFKLRDRPVSVNPLTGQQFQWPTPTMVKRIESFGFHLIPIGYAPKIRKNPFRELEWKIVFPKAERFLEANLTNAQVKIFMLSKALIKTFVEPQQIDNAPMFTIEHLRMHLFWECERNYGAWPEEFVGEVLIRFLKSFMDRLRNTVLPDFFIKERNLFESIPESSLSRLQNIIAEIVENPVMHLMAAYRNLHDWEEILPKLNYNSIFSNIVENDIFRLKMLSKNSKSILVVEPKQSWEEVTVHTDDASADQDSGVIAIAKQREATKKSMRRRTMQLKQNIEMKRRIEYEKSRQSVDSIDLEFIFNRNISTVSRRKDYNEGVENLRRTNVLEVFIDNFIAMAERLIPLRSIHLAKIYLNQARRLCRIYHDNGCDTNAIELLSKVESIDEDLEILYTTANDIPPPVLPIRMSVEPKRVVYQKEPLSNGADKVLKMNGSDGMDKNRRKNSVRFVDDETPYGHDFSVPRKIVTEVQLHTHPRPESTIAKWSYTAPQIKADTSRPMLAKVGYPKKPDPIPEPEVINYRALLKPTGRIPSAVSTPDISSISPEPSPVPSLKYDKLLSRHGSTPALNTVLVFNKQKEIFSRAKGPSKDSAISRDYESSDSKFNKSTDESRNRKIYDSGTKELSESRYIESSRLRDKSESRSKESLRDKFESRSKESSRSRDKSESRIKESSRLRDKSEAMSKESSRSRDKFESRSKESSRLRDKSESRSKESSRSRDKSESRSKGSSRSSDKSESRSIESSRSKDKSESRTKGSSRLRDKSESRSRESSRSRDKSESRSKESSRSRDKSEPRSKESSRSGAKEMFESRTKKQFGSRAKESSDFPPKESSHSRIKGSSDSRYKESPDAGSKESHRSKTRELSAPITKESSNSRSKVAHSSRPKEPSHPNINKSSKVSESFDLRNNESDDSKNKESYKSRASVLYDSKTPKSYQSRTKEPPFPRTKRTQESSKTADPYKSRKHQFTKTAESDNSRSNDYSNESKKYSKNESSDYKIVESSQTRTKESFGSSYKESLPNSKNAYPHKTNDSSDSITYDSSESAFTESTEPIVKFILPKPLIKVPVFPVFPVNLKKMATKNGTPKQIHCNEKEPSEHSDPEDIPDTFKGRMAKVHRMLLKNNVYSDQDMSESTNV